MQTSNSKPKFFINDFLGKKINLFFVNFHLFLTLSGFIPVGLFAQIPINDPAWILDTSLSDDFSGSTLKSYKWWAEDSIWNGHGLSMMFKRNVIISNGTMKIIVDTLIPYRTYQGVDYYYQSGTVNSNNTSFKYGYLEISAKFPAGNIAYWPAFWLWMGSCSQMWYNEVDIAENGGDQSLEGHQMGTNVHLSMPDSCTINIDLPFTVSGLPRIDSAFHKYALQWNSNNLYFYFDDNLVRYLHDNDGDSIPQHYLQLVFDIYVNPWASLPHMPADTFEIDYFNYYKLNVSCNDTLTICNPNSDYYSANPPRAVKKSIKTGSSCSPTFSTDDKATLRATDYIILDEGTTINAGTDTTGHFTIIVEPCPQ